MVMIISFTSLICFQRIDRRFIEDEFSTHVLVIDKSVMLVQGGACAWFSK